MEAPRFPQILIQLRPGSSEALISLRDELGDWIDPESEVEVEERSAHSLEPVTVSLTIFATALAFDIIMRITDWIRSRNHCLVVIDARQAPVLVTERCDVPSMRGKTVIVNSIGEHVRIDSPPTLMDMDQFIARAVALPSGSTLELLTESGGQGGEIDQTVIEFEAS